LDEGVLLSLRGGEGQHAPGVERRGDKVITKEKLWERSTRFLSGEEKVNIFQVRRGGDWVEIF
jgi:hypothetical protein